MMNVLNRVTSLFRNSRTQPQRVFNDILTEYWRSHWRHLDSAPMVDSAIRNHLRPGLGDIPCSELTREKVLEWHSSMHKTPRFANECLLLGRRAWYALLPNSKNPFAGINLYPERVRTRRWTDDERERFVVALGEMVRRKELQQVYADALWVIRGTLARKSEILKLRRSQIDLTAEVAVIEDHKTDHEQGARVIHLAAVMDVIRRRCEIAERTGTAFLFPSKRSRSGHLEKVTPAFHRVCERAGIVRTRDQVLHMLRGDGATLASEIGTDVRVIQEMLGHKNPATTARYVRPGPASVRSATLRVGEKLGGAPW